MKIEQDAVVKRKLEQNGKEKREGRQTDRGDVIEKEEKK